MGQEKNSFSISDVIICDELDDWLTRNNRVCDYLYDNGLCKWECYGIGYCGQCLELANELKKSIERLKGLEL